MRRSRSVTVAILMAAGVVLAASPASAASALATGAVDTVASFNPAALETPENIVFDHHGNAYITLALTGEIRKLAADGTQSTFAMLPLGAPPLTFCGSFFAGLTGIAMDGPGSIYVNLASCDPDSRGVWRIPPDSPPARIAALPLSSLPNGIVHHHGDLYLADSTLGVVWRVPDRGGTPEIWANGAALAVQGVGLPGPNGLKIFHDELYVSNPSQSTVVAIGVEPDGSAGSVRTHASGVFCDDFAFDVRGDLYCGTDPFHTVIRIDPAGAVDTLLTAADGLDGPTATAFGQGDEVFELYITNGAFPFFPGQTPRRPSLMRITVDTAGLVLAG